MSSMERNKGKLIPSNFNEVLEDYPNATIDDIEWETDGEFMSLHSNIYRVEWEVNQDSDCCGFADVKTHPDGSIDFHTYHYNGGGYWTEVVEGALN